MKIKDSKVISLLKQADNMELDMLMREYPDEDVCGRSDIEVFIGQLLWMLDLYYSDDTILHDDLEEAREKIKHPEGCSKVELICAKDVVNEYNRLRAVMRTITK